MIKFLLLVLLLSVNAHADIDGISTPVSIKSASEGLYAIRKDGFMDIELAELKGKLLAGEIEELSEKEFPTTNPYGNREFGVNISKNRYVRLARITFYVDRRVDDPAEFAIDDPEFDITPQDARDYAAKLGLGDPKGMAADFYGLTWRWNSDGFDCKLQVVDYPSGLIKSLMYDCLYRRHNPERPDT